MDSTQHACAITAASLCMSPACYMSSATTTSSDACPTMAPDANIALESKWVEVLKWARQLLTHT